ncbi:MAG: hypothetical protein AAGI51_07245 [Pseudomonadota bacterium]
MSGTGMTFEMFEPRRRPGGPSASGDPASGSRSAPLLADFGGSKKAVRAKRPRPVRADEASGAAVRRPPAAAPEPTPAEDARRLARLRGEARALGFAEGVARAEAETQAELRLIAADLREGLAEALHAVVEREQAMNGRMKELAEALLAAAAPAFARAGLAAEVAEAVGAALRDADEGLGARVGEDHLTIRVAPEQAERTRVALAAAGFSTPVAEDARLGPLRAELDWGGGADRIDLGAALAAAQDALARHLDAQERTAAHG